LLLQWPLVHLSDHRRHLGVGIVILSMVLGAVGIPSSGVALIMGVDRILDMCRTSINVMGDLVACRLMKVWVGGEGTAEEKIEAAAKEEPIEPAVSDETAVS
jgi:Na+/H+-dicarboxylate symporter